MSDRPLFALQCADESYHEPHEYVKRWRKRLLPFLRNSGDYPDSWNVTYRCRGVEDPDTWTDPNVRCPFCKSTNVLGINWGSRFISIDDAYDYEEWACRDCGRGWER